MDLGAGDARFSAAAARVQSSVRCVAVENDAARVELAKENVQNAGVEGQVDVRYEDLLKTDFSEATVLFFFLLPMPLAELRTSLLTFMSRGGRIVSMAFQIPGLLATESKKVSVKYVADGFSQNLYLYEDVHRTTRAF